MSEISEIKNSIKKAVLHLCGKAKYPEETRTFISYRINLPELKNYFESLKVKTKTELLEFVLGLKKVEREAFLEHFKKELSLHPTDVEFILGCSSTERKRWTEEGKIPVLGEQSFYKYGKYNHYPIFDLRTIVPLISKVEGWRSRNQKRVAKNRKLAAKKASETRVLNQAKVSGFLVSYEQMLSDWQVVPDAIPVLQLAYWSTWVSRWAKEYQLKAQNAVKYGDRYQRLSSELYELKNQAIKVLSTSPYTKLAFYRPEEPDKLIWGYADKPEDDDWDEDDDYDDYYDFRPQNRRVVIGRKKDFYSLYYLAVEHPDIVDSFSFHTPYPMGCEFLPPKESLPRVDHQEQEGVFRFGRSLFDEEKITHTEKRVRAEFEKALNQLQQALKNNNTIIHDKPVPQEMVRELIEDVRNAMADMEDLRLLELICDWLKNPLGCADDDRIDAIAEELGFSYEEIDEDFVLVVPSPLALSNNINAMSDSSFYHSVIALADMALPKVKFSSPPRMLNDSYEFLQELPEYLRSIAASESQL